MDRDEDLFFHVSEVPREDAIAIGTEVEFNVAVDQRSGKMSGVHVSVLPKGTVKFEDISNDRYRGTVTVPLTYEKDGLIEYALNGETASIPYAPGAAAYPLETGDEVEFNIVTKKRRNEEFADFIKVTKFQGKREYGKISSIKEGYGFIKCAAEPTSLYFHFNDVLHVPEQHRIDVGLEVEYSTIIDRRNKPSAVRVLGLPKGSVKFKEVLPERIRGIVDRELIGELSFNRKLNEEDMGIITRAKEGEEGAESYSFTGKDVEDIRRSLHVGDEVEFNAVIYTRTKHKKATSIVLIKAAPEVREEGVISDIKKHYGYLSSPNRDDDIFFHFTDYPENLKLEVGVEVEFSIVTEPRSRKKKAVKFTHLPTNTVKFHVRYL